MKKILFLIFFYFYILSTVCFSAQDDLDMFGGWEGKQATTVKAVVGNSAETVTGLILHDTGAFAGKDLKGSRLQPDNNEYMYFLIDGNDDDNVYVVPNDWGNAEVITNGDMELDSDWSDYNTPTANEQSSSNVLPTWHNDFNLHVSGDANDGVIQSNIALDRVESDCVSAHTYGWDGKYTAIGYIYVVSGTVYMEVIDGDGSTSIKNVQIGTTSGNKWEDFEITSITTNKTDNCGTGQIRFYCYGDSCEFYLDNVSLTEYDYGYYQSYTGLNDYNTGTQAYTVYAPWSTELIGNRWFVIDPLSNVFLLKSMNNLDVSLINGVDFDGNNLCANMNTKYGTYASCGDHTMDRIQKIMDIGFNSAGSIKSDKISDENIYPLTEPLMPMINQSRVSAWNFADVGEINFYNSSYDYSWPDVFDSNWSSKFNDFPNGVFAVSWGLGSVDDEFRQTTSSFDFTPYKKSYLRNAANIWLIGVDLDEEPLGSGSGGNNLGYMIFTTIPSDTTDTDTVNDTKIAFVNWLRAKYTSGGETTFISNIGFDGTNEITAPDSWSEVTGYNTTDTDSDGTSDKDEAAITALNTAWGTTYPTQVPGGATNAWEYLLYEDGDDSADVFSSGKDANAGFESVVGCGFDTGGCIWNPATNTVREDLDDLHGNYAKKWIRPFYLYLFGPDGYSRGSIINFGMGVSYHLGWAKGSHEGETKYLNVLYTHGFGGDVSAGSCFASADQSPFPTDDALSNFRNYYSELEIPIAHESVWVTAEADTQHKKEGTIDAVYKLEDTDYAVYPVTWDCDSTQFANINSYCDHDVDATETATYRIDEDTAVYWNCSDPTNTGTCSDSGILFWQWIRYIDQPSSNSAYADKAIIIANSASIGDLADNDVITNGSKMFTLTATPTRRSMIVDEDANFNTNYNSPLTWAQRYSWSVVVDDDDPSPKRYYMIYNNYATERSVMCYKDFSNDGVGYSQDPGSFKDINVGDNYHFNFMFQYGATFRDEHYELLTQSRRANMYVNVYKQLFEGMKTEDGVYFDVGFSHFSPWDYGFPTYTSAEFRNFGLFSIKDNAYDGMEATTLGADGILGTADDEEDNYEDFITPLSGYLNNVYRDLFPKQKIPSGRFMGGVIK